MPAYEALAIFGTSFLVGLSGALMPGPLLALDIRESTVGGFWAGPYIATGHSLLELLVVILLAVSLLQIIEQGPVFTVIALLGGLFLLWMGWRMVRRPAQGFPATSEGARIATRYSPGTSDPRRRCVQHHQSFLEPVVGYSGRNVHG